MVSPVFILCSVLLLSGIIAEDVDAEVEPTPTDVTATTPEATTKKKFV